MCAYLQELEVIKVKRSEGSECYVATLNSSGSAPPQAVLNATATVIPRNRKWLGITKSNFNTFARCN